MKKNLIRAALVVLAATLLAVVAGGFTHPQTQSSVDSYPYQSPRFDRLIRESYASSSNAPQEFYSWLGKAYAASSKRLPGKTYPTLSEHLRIERQHLANITDPSDRTRQEVALAEWAHKLIRIAMPKFSLDRGFEFKHAVKFGERQCFLQSVLAVGLLQRMGVRSGVVMVYRSERGEESNNGHAVALVRLYKGQDVILDASHAEPFVRQQGLFARRRDYVYLDPVFLGESPRIVAYRTASGGQRIATHRVKAMDYAFIRSQFYYYRGERAKGGLLASCQTASGLASGERNLRESVRLCPKNPLAVYMLGRTCLCEGNPDQARALLEKANRLYESFGWVPAGAIEYLDLARRPSSTSHKS
jgi:hypothetical protein